MKYTRSISQNGNLYPAAFNVLSVLPPQMLHQGEHDSLRHPLATYNLSIGRVLEAFRGVLDQLKSLDAAPVNASGSLEFDPEPLLTAQKELLDSLASHIDDGYQILKAIYPLSTCGPGSRSQTGGWKRPDTKRSSAAIASLLHRTETPSYLS